MLMKVVFALFLTFALGTVSFADEAKKDNSDCPGNEAVNTQKIQKQDQGRGTASVQQSTDEDDQALVSRPPRHVGNLENRN